MDCTDAYRAALAREFSSTVSSAPAPTSPPRRPQAAGARRDGVAGHPPGRRTDPGKDDVEAAAPADPAPGGPPGDVAKT